MRLKWRRSIDIPGFDVLPITPCSSAKSTSRLHLPLPRRERARGRPHQATHHQESRPQGSRGRLRRARTPGHVGRPLRRARHGSVATRSRQPRRPDLQAHRPTPVIRAAMGRDRLQWSDRRTPRRPQLRVPGGARRVRHRTAPDHGVRCGPRLREVDGRLRHPRDRGVGVASFVSGHGVARRGTAGRAAEGRDAVRAAHRQGPDRGAAVRAPPRSVQRAVGGFHGHHLAAVSPAQAGRHWARRAIRKITGPT